MKWIDFNLRHANYALHVLHEHNRTLSKIPHLQKYWKDRAAELEENRRKALLLTSASNNLSASMLRISKKGAFQKRLSFKYSQSLKVKQDL